MAASIQSVKNTACRLRALPRVHGFRPGDQIGRRVCSLLDDAGAVIVTGVSTDGPGELISLVDQLALGRPITSGNSISSHPLVDGFVYRIESRNEGLGVRDEEGLSIFSTTADEFDCHSDGYHDVAAVDTVLMLCASADPAGGGATTLAHVDDLAPHLNEDDAKLLSSALFPAACGDVAVLESIQAGWRVRFNLAEIERFWHRPGNSPNLTAAHLVAARNLAALTKSPTLTTSFVLAPGECLILDNHKVLHGRSRFDASADRLLYRIWLAANGSRSEGRVA